ncbi:MAG TPA: Gfo/Idh/MocA family oxidoreductase [Phycisphaerae bacterium]|jgi:predicted dehydrogenase
MSQRLRTAVIGLGHMGRHHARIYAGLPGVQLVACIDTDPSKAEELAGKYRCAAGTRIDPFLGGVDAISVAVPTVYHEAVAGLLIEAGVATLIEKPLAPDSAAARRLVEKAAKRGCTLAVGHSERFNPVVLALQRMQVAPKFIETHRISPFTFRSADIGVVFDMMIHDIDIVLHLVGERAYRASGVGVNVLGDHEDIANARIEFASGAVANLTASRLALKTERKIRVFSPDAYLSMDFQKKSGIAIKKDANLNLLKLARERNFEDLSQMQGVDFGKMVNVEPLQIDDVEPLRAEIEAFLHSARTGARPAVPAEDGLAAVEMAEAIVASIRAHDWNG